MARVVTPGPGGRITITESDPADSLVRAEYNPSKNPPWTVTFRYINHPGETAAQVQLMFFGL